MNLFPSLPRSAISVSTFERIVAKSAALRLLFLPAEITSFERAYLARVNRVALLFFAAHVPALTLIALFNGTGWHWAFALAAATQLGPLVATTAFSEKAPRFVSVVYGVTAMMMGGLLVHFGQGPVQVEMHFYFFALIAMLVVFGNPMVIVAAAATVALHHLAVFLVLPSSLLNYQAPIWVVGVHAGFVVLESIACVFIARGTFDNMIGLERVVAERTREVVARTRDLQMVLDHVEQGLVTIDLEGQPIVGSAAFDRWFGSVPAGTKETLFDRFGRKESTFAANSSAAWMQVQMDMLPLDLVLEQMPSSATFDGKHLDIRYLPIADSANADPSAIPARFLVVVSDVTSVVARERAETERREALAIFDRILTDPGSLSDYRDEGDRLVAEVLKGDSPALVSRALHTLKGNSAQVGLTSLERLCHSLETTFAEANGALAPKYVAELQAAWHSASSRLDRYLSSRGASCDVKGADVLRVESMVRRSASRDAVLRALHDLRLEPTQRRLARFSDLAKRLGHSLERAPIDVVIESNDERADGEVLAPFWSAFTHLIRNAVDHGAETSEEREAAGKPQHVTLSLRTGGDSEHLMIEVEDDGRGIDWTKVAARADALGLPSVGRDALTHALFTDGCSTATKVTEVSGRGVGMGAVLQAVTELRGHLSIFSESGRGTTIRATFPREVAQSLSTVGRGPSLFPTSNAA